MPSAWTRLRAAVDPIVRPYNLYTAYAIGGVEHVGTTHDLTIPDARAYLRRNAYEPQYLSAAKRHPATGRLHDLSYRRVPTRHPDAAAGTPLAERFDPEECQYHVHVFAWDSMRIDWYSHYEARPDFFRPAFDLGRLREHYRPEYGDTYLRGVTDLDI